MANMANLKTLLNNNNQNIKDYIDAIKIKYDSDNKEIILFNEKNNIKTSIDATEFIKDGMIKTVELIDNNLKITWNADADENVTNIPLNDFIDIYEISGKNTDTINITASTENNKHTVEAKIINNSITNEHIASDAAIIKDKLAADVQTSLGLADTAIQSLDGYAKIGNSADDYTKETLYGVKAYAKDLTENLTEISSPNSSIKVTEYDVDIKADTVVNIKTTGTDSSVVFDTKHVTVPDPVNNEDAANKKYVDSKITDNIITEEKLEEKNYVTAEILENNNISLNTNWNNIQNKPTIYPTNWDNIQNKPTIYPTNWDSIQDKPNDIMTLNEYQENINQIANNKNQIDTLSTTLYATNLTAEEAKTKAEAALTTDANGKIQIGGIEFPAMNNNNASIDYSEEYGVAIYTPNGNISLSLPSTSYINLNGNIKLLSNYSILDEDDNDRLANKPLCYTGNIIKFLNDDSTEMTHPIIKEDTEFDSKIYYTQFGNVLSLNVNTAFYSSDFEETSYYKAHLIKLPPNFISQTNKDYKYLVKIYYREGSVENLKTITNALLSQVTEKREYLEIDLSFLTSKNISTFETYSDIFIEISYFHQETI